MPSAQNKEIMRHLVDEYFNTGDPAGLEEWFSPDFVNHNPSWGLEGDRQGLEHVRVEQSGVPGGLDVGVRDLPALLDHRGREVQGRLELRVAGVALAKGDRLVLGCAGHLRLGGVGGRAV